MLKLIVPKMTKSEFEFVQKFERYGLAKSSVADVKKIEDLYNKYLEPIGKKGIPYTGWYNNEVTKMNRVISFDSEAEHEGNSVESLLKGKVVSLDFYGTITRNILKADDFHTLLNPTISNRWEQFMAFVCYKNVPAKRKKK